MESASMVLRDQDVGYLIETSRVSELSATRVAARQ